MTERTRGLYEVLLTEAIEAQLGQLGKQLRASKDDLRAAEAADRFALHVSQLLRRVLDDVPDSDRVKAGAALTRRLVQQINEALGYQSQGDEPIEPATVLSAIVGLLPDGRVEEIARPLLPLLDTTLLTNAPGEPSVGNQIRTELRSADRIDAVMAFIRMSGIRPLLDDLRHHCEAGKVLRILTTTYTGSTEQRALDELKGLGAQVRVSYEMGSTRLHAKAWLFNRHSGFSTAYIGSSNLTHSAQISGLEWNVRVSSARNPDVVSKVEAVFESYWNSQDFVDYDPDVFSQHVARGTSGIGLVLSPIEVRPEPFQERLLEQIALAREEGHHRNLLVSATGTGKTVMAALDYARLRARLPRSRLLFVAHREEILSQSLATFRHALRDHAFGELWVGGRKPERFEHVFASIQSLSASGLTSLDPSHFDVVIVDEFHHAAASSYVALLRHVAPVELLGLTATPERTDGLSVLEWFDGRIAAELRLWDAIDQHRLSPFVYYGISDGLDLREVPWRRGHGYDTAALSNVLTANDANAKHVIAQLVSKVDDVRQMRALGFCVSVAHAKFMARVFNDSGVPSVAVWADSPDDERVAALRNLAERRINVVFSVDLFNEGVDVPAVDTLILLRPTDSPVLFIQQLGRGLRRSLDKTVCTVLDFVGQHRKEFRFDRRFRALLGGTRKDLEEQIQNEFPFLPAGCHMELDRVASERILANIRAAIPSRWSEKTAELRQIAAGDNGITLSRFLEEAGLELEDVYTNNKTWSDLREAAGLSVEASGPDEVTLRRACSRLLHINDLERIGTFRRMLSAEAAPDSGKVSESQRRLLRMLVVSMTSQVSETPTSLQGAADLVWSHRQIRTELLALFEVLATRIDHVQVPLAEKPEVPLRIHARYTRPEILAAFGVGSGSRAVSWREGVRWVPEERTDLLAFTLDKTTGAFSPTTRYRDFAISRELIHWESQSVTSETSEPGMRYQQHVALGNSVMLFARVRRGESFWFLGPATYVKHESERPMAVTWKVQYPLPGDLFAQFAAAVA